MASPAFEPVLGNNYAIFVTTQDEDELKTTFNKLAEGAERVPIRFQAPHELPIGTYGQVYDRYDVHWIFLRPRLELDLPDC